MGKSAEEEERGELLFCVPELFCLSARACPCMCVCVFFAGVWLVCSICQSEMMVMAFYVSKGAHGAVLRFLQVSFVLAAVKFDVVNGILSFNSLQLISRVLLAVWAFH